MNHSADLQQPPTDGRVRHLARTLIGTGRLPRVPAEKQSCGASTGATCAVCQGAILQPSVEYMLQFAPETGPGGERRVLHFHAFCLHAWEAERARSEESPDGSP